MITVSRNLLVVLTAFVATFVAAAVGQGVFSTLFPVFSARIVGSTDVATYFLLALLAVLFFVFGVVVPRWMRGTWVLPWLLLPIVSLYLVAIFGQPGAYRCNPLNATYVVSCWMVISPFVVSAAAVVLGYLVRRGKQQWFAHAV